MFRSISVILALTLSAVAAADYDYDCDYEYGAYGYDSYGYDLGYGTSETNRLLSEGNYIQHQRNELLYDPERRLRNEAYDARIERQRAAAKTDWAAHEQRMDRMQNVGGPYYSCTATDGLS